MAEKEKTVVIRPPKFETIALRIIGESPYMQHKFSKKGELMNTMAEGSTAKSKKQRKARDYESDYRSAMYVSEDGWNGINAACIRNACISACRVIGFKMTLMKLSLFAEADGYDKTEGTPLIRIHGEPELNSMPARNSNGSVDVRVRPLWRKWHCDVRLRYDADQFTSEDVVNLLMRAGMQVGIGEGRPDSRMSAGLGYGLFRVETVQ